MIEIPPIKVNILPPNKKTVLEPNVYDSQQRKYGGNDFYCGEQLSLLAIYLKKLKDGDISLQYAYDEIVNNIIINHVIKNSDCGCKQYLHELEDHIKRLEGNKCPQ